MDCVLVVDDEPAIRNLERVILELAGYQVLTAADGSEALSLIELTEPDVLVLDIEMPGMDGKTLFRRLSKLDHRPKVLVVASGAGRARRELGAEGSVEKPFAPDDLVAGIEALQRDPPAEAA